MMRIDRESRQAAAEHHTGQGPHTLNKDVSKITALDFKSVAVLRLIF